MYIVELRLNSDTNLREVVLLESHIGRATQTLVSTRCEDELTAYRMTLKHLVDHNLELGKLCLRNTEVPITAKALRDLIGH